MIGRSSSIFQLVFVWLLSSASAASPDPSFRSCVGHRSTYIDREYCEAVYADTPCDSVDECHSNTSASCSSICATAGCECNFQPLNCTQEEPCGQFACLPPDEPAYVGSCHFFQTEESCKSVTGCSWEGYDTTGVVTKTKVESSSSVSIFGIVVIVVVGVVVLSLTPIIIYLCVKRASAAPVKDPSKPVDISDNISDDTPVAAAVTLDEEEQKVDNSK